MGIIRISTLNQEHYSWEHNKISMVQTFAGLTRHNDTANNSYVNLSDFPKKISYKLKELPTFDPQDPEHAKDADKDIEFRYDDEMTLYALYHQDEFLGPLLDGVNYVNVDVDVQITEIKDLHLLNNNFMKFTSIETSIDLIQHAVQNDYTHILQNAEQIKLYKRHSKEEVVELLQVLRGHNCVPQKIALDLYPNDIMVLNAIEHDVCIIDYRQQLDPRVNNLFKQFYTQILDKNPVESALESAISASLSTNQKPYSTGQALGILQGFDWSYLGLEAMTQTINELRPQYSVAPETYHYQAQADLHFYMTKVVDDNVSIWSAYAYNESNLAPNFSLSTNHNFDVAKSKSDIGIEAFKRSLQDYNNFETEVWVAYAANKIIDIPSKPELGVVEMFVTSATSEHSVFITNSGIARAPSYNGDKHSKLAMQLHGFAAKIMLQMHESLSYMINSPAYKMMEIIVDSFKTKFGDTSSLYLGNGYHEVKEELSDLQKQYSEFKENGWDKAGKGQNDYFSLCKDIVLREQQDLQVKKPFEIEFVDRKLSSFTLFDKNNNQLCKLTSEDIHGDYEWFFGNRYSSDGLKGSWGATLATLDIDALSEFIEITGEVEHFDLG